MTTPDPRDLAAVISRTRSDGSVMWSRGAIPEDFLAWRRGVRSAARQAGLRPSVRRVSEIVLVEHLDHVVTRDQHGAFAKVVEAQIEEREISWQQVLHEAARDRMKPVLHETTSHTDA